MRCRSTVVAVVAGLCLCRPQSASADPDCTGITPVSGTGIQLQLVASGLSSPLYLTAPPGDVARIFIVEKGGRIRIVDSGSILPTPFLDLSGLVSTTGERGLLGLAFHPSYGSNGRFFVDYTDASGNIVIAEYAVSGDPNVATPTGTVLLTIPHAGASNHNGGDIAFGPDNYLYIGVGDGGGSGDAHGPIGNGQNTTVLLGKLLRIDVDSGAPYAIPSDNPFFGSMTSRQEIWAYGLRNPWRYSFDLVTGDLYIGDVGQNMWEEVDYEPASAGGGQNYGWRLIEGDACFNPSTNCTTTGLTFPLVIYSHSNGRCATIGGYVYRGCAMPDLRGTYFYGDLCAAVVYSFEVSNGNAVNQLDHSSQVGSGTTIGSVASFGQDARGELYICDISAGKVFKIVPGTTQAVPLPTDTPRPIPAEPRWGLLLFAVVLLLAGGWLIARPA
ncbi:MAG TPA: PQQ-dependent sugar dehydrogenase [Candidatus Binatia bacterium]|nr:PQQ-dependent sugar dehydrogenase [Candidatus Binatia bacterium]